MPGFKTVFGVPPEANARAPGRVNLLGEHTDYNDGYVLPTPIPQQTEVTLAVSSDGLFHFRSAQVPEAVSYSERERPPAGFGRYLYGCIEVLRARGHAIPPLMMFIESSVPMGSGLSSSAALEVAALRALRRRFALEIDDVELALLAQEAEVRFAEVRCGIMDQMVASLGSPGEMLFLDTRSLERAVLPLPDGADITVIDSGVPRALAASGYNTRRAECEAAARTLGVAALRDVVDEGPLASLPEPLKRRARHVVTENARVLAAAGGVDAKSFGALMNASHASLRDDYEVSLPQLDFLVDTLQRHPRVHGARITGAGFGGACVALLEKGYRDAVLTEVLREYQARGLHGRALL
jgi:galactokinase